ncbi:MAG: hypothetical protein ABFD96_03965 [Armatimonadia bacterium]
MAEPRFADAGWTWEGQATDPGVPPSIFGVGEAADFFGVNRSIFLFHPTTALALRKLSDKAEVAVDISKWVWEEHRLSEDFYHVAWHSKRDSRPEVAVAEADLLSRLSVDFPNVTGGFIDDTTCMFEYGSYSTQVPEQIRAALHSANPNLKLWIVVYVTQLDEGYWEPFLPFVDIISLWMGVDDIPNLERHVDRCREVFPGKEICVGSYIRDYLAQRPNPLDKIELQYETMYRLWREGRIDGYNVLSANAIDLAVPECEWIRDFIAAH